MPSFYFFGTWLWLWLMGLAIGSNSNYTLRSDFWLACSCNEKICSLILSFEQSPDLNSTINSHSNLDMANLGNQWNQVKCWSCCLAWPKQAMPSSKNSIKGHVTTFVPTFFATTNYILAWKKFSRTVSIEWQCCIPLHGACRWLYN